MFWNGKDDMTMPGIESDRRAIEEICAARNFASLVPQEVQSLK